MRKLFFLVFAILSSCCPQSPEYRDFYTHVHEFYISETEMTESDYFLVILVDAHHLDYTNNESFLGTVAKHPRNGSKAGQVGHAWIYLQGWLNGKKIVIEGGHSGERGYDQAKYFDGVMDYNEWGYVNPSEEQKRHPRYEPNPIKYLWTVQRDGFFQRGSGGHQPTFAAKIDLSEEQFKRILTFIQHEYVYRHYSLTHNQCSSFVAQVASIAGVDLETNVSMSLRPFVDYGGRRVRFWQDPRYSVITFASPDIIERSLIEAVEEGRAEPALSWYLN